MTTNSSPFSRRPLRISLAALLALVLIAGGAMAVSAATRTTATAGSSNGFRTATVSRQAVLQSLDNVGVIEPVGEASVAFPVAGTISSVAVNLGDTVTVGQQLASLNTTSLTSDLASDEASLAAANLTLYEALNDEPITGGSGGGSGSGGSQGAFATAAVTSPSAPIDATLDDDVVPTSTTEPGTTTTTTVPSTTTTTVPSGGQHGGGGSSASLAAAEQAVLADQKKVDADLAKAATDLATANQVCGMPSPTPPPTPSSTTTTTTPSGGTGDAAACSAALEQELEDQQATAADQNKLASDSEKLDKLITASEGSGSGSGKTGGSSGKSFGSSSSHSGTGTSGRTGTSASTTSTPSAAQLVAYQAAVDAAELQVEVGIQAIAQATVVSPIGGTVVADTMNVGDSVTAGSTTDDIVIQGTGGYEVSTTVSVDDISKVKVGQVADVVPDGVAQTITGKIVSVGIAADTSGSTTTYPVVIGFDGSPAGLRNGATASVSIVIDKSATSLAVPTSALSMTGTQYSVNLLVKGKSTSTNVEVGAIGTQYTAVTSGLKLGQVVILAQMSAPLPSSATATATTTGTGRTGAGAGGTGTGRFGGAGGFGGGGFGGGGGGGTGRGG